LQLQDSVSGYHVYPFLTDRRDELRAFLQANNIETLVHYPRLVHWQKGFRGRLSGGCVNAEKMAKSELSLPISPFLADSEIEKVIFSIESIKQNVVLALGEGNEKYLACFYIQDTNVKLETNDILEACEKELPNYMVPTFFKQLDVFPLTNNKKVDRKEEVLDALKFISTPKEDHNLSIITKAGLLWDTKQEKAIERGNLVHFVLSKIKTTEDIDFAFSDLLVSGDVTNQNLKELKSLVLNVIEHPKLKSYFQDEFKIYNERDIITNSGQLLRPDRLNINSKNEVIIIDYKTGDHKSHHKSQLNAYDYVLNQMNLKVTNKLLVYINDTVDVIEV
jgi:hypothetical protein